MTRNWNELEGVSLAGRYWLKQCLGSTADDAWYLTRFDTTRDAAVRVLADDAPSAGERLALWREAMGFDHPNIVRMLDAGRADAEGAGVIYAVCEQPDDFLAAAVEQRRLSSAEALEVLRALLSALAFLHDNGFAHGAVDPEHIMAFGDTIKLPSDTIHRGDHTADIVSLGATLQAILPQPPPEPFATILRHTLTQDRAERWTVHDIEHHLQPPPVALASKAPDAGADREWDSPRAPRVQADPPHIGRRDDAGPMDPAFAAGQLDADPRESASPPHTRQLDRGFPMKWVPIAGLVAAVALGAVFLRHPGQPAPKPAPQAAPPPVVRPARPAPLPPPRVAEAPVERPNPSAIWRVVVYTYYSRAAAEKKARSLNEKHPGLHAEVFAPKGNRSPYYISLGGRMTLPQAERLQREARAKGLPRDTFVRNFTS